MIGKLIALVAFVAAVASADCGFYNIANTRRDCNRVCETSTLSFGPSFSVASSCPSCSQIVHPSCVVEPFRTIDAQIPSRVVAVPSAPVPVVATPVATTRVTDCDCSGDCGNVCTSRAFSVC